MFNLPTITAANYAKMWQASAEAEPDEAEHVRNTKPLQALAELYVQGDNWYYYDPEDASNDTANEALGLFPYPKPYQETAPYGERQVARIATPDGYTHSVDVYALGNLEVVQINHSGCSAHGELPTYFMRRKCQVKTK
jgi:PPE-repeat protein